MQRTSQPIPVPTRKTKTRWRRKKRWYETYFHCAFSYGRQSNVCATVLSLLISWKIHSQPPIVNFRTGAPVDWKSHSSSFRVCLFSRNHLLDPRPPPPNPPCPLSGLYPTLILPLHYSIPVHIVGKYLSPPAQTPQHATHYTHLHAITIARLMARAASRTPGRWTWRRCGRLCRTQRLWSASFAAFPKTK